MKTLLLMRHAKSDWDADYSADHERPLNDRGLRSARLMGRLIAGLDLTPNHVMSSTAVRARTTAALASDAGDWRAHIDLESGFYGSGPEAVLDIAALSPNVERLMLVGHQPTWGMIVNRLTGAVADMKTASVAAIAFMIDDWGDLGGAQGVLTSLQHPRPYFGSQWDLG